MFNIKSIKNLKETKRLNKKFSNLYFNRPTLSELYKRGGEKCLKENGWVPCLCGNDGHCDQCEGTGWYRPTTKEDRKLMKNIEITRYFMDYFRAKKFLNL